MNKELNDKLNIILLNQEALALMLLHLTHAPTSYSSPARNAADRCFDLVKKNVTEWLVK